MYVDTYLYSIYVYLFVFKSADLSERSSVLESICSSFQKTSIQKKSIYLYILLLEETARGQIRLW